MKRIIYITLFTLIIGLACSTTDTVDPSINPVDESTETSSQSTSSIETNLNQETSKDANKTHINVEPSEKDKSISDGSKPLETSCLLAGGETVEVGWSGNDTGNNSCNLCMCSPQGLGCTKMACLDNANLDSPGELLELPLESLELPESMTETMVDIANDMMQDTGKQTSGSSVQDPCLKMPVKTRPMCYMMMQTSQADRIAMGQNFMSSSRDDTPPVLYNLLIEDFGALNPKTSMMGPFKFSKSFAAGSKPTVFDEFGKVHDAGKPTEYENPTFEYKFPVGTQLLSPVTGIVDNISWQPTESYKQDDWELNIKPSRFSQWRVSIDHIVSLGCDLSSNEVCTKPLLINGEELKVGMEIKAGDKIGYAGNWIDTSNSGMNERTEITVGRFAADKVFESYCPIMYLHESVKQDYRDSISALMDSYEEWTGNNNLYNQSEMVEPGCLYEQINDIGNKTTVIK